MTKKKEKRQVRINHDQDTNISLIKKLTQKIHQHWNILSNINRSHTPIIENLYRKSITSPCLAQFDHIIAHYSKRIARPIQRELASIILFIHNLKTLGTAPNLDELVFSIFIIGCIRREKSLPQDQTH